MQTKFEIPAIGQPFSVSFTDGSVEFDAMIIYRDTDPRESDREYRLLIYNKVTTNTTYKTKNPERSTTISCVEKNWFDTELTGRRIKPRNNPEFVLINLVDLIGKNIKDAMVCIRSPRHIELSGDLRYRKLKKVFSYMEKGKEWVQANFEREGDDSCDFTGCTVKANTCQFIFKAEDAKKIGL